MEKCLGLMFLIGAIQLATAIPKYYMDTTCGQSIFLDENIAQIKLYLTRSSHYNPNMQCTLNIYTSNFNTSVTERIMFYFNSLSIESSSTCNRDWLDVRDGSSASAPYVPGIAGRLCGYSYSSSHIYRTSSDAMFLNFRSDNTWNDGGFQMVITRYHTGSCTGDEYECDNGRCISDYLECNGQNPCGDHSDCPLTAGAIAGIVVGSLAFTCLVVVCVLIVCRRRRRRGYIGQTVVSTGTYGSSNGYNQPVPQQYPAYPQGQQPYPAQAQQPYPAQNQQPYS